MVIRNHNSNTWLQHSAKNKIHCLKCEDPFSALQILSLFFKRFHLIYLTIAPLAEFPNPLELIGMNVEGWFENIHYNALQEKNANFEANKVTKTVATYRSLPTPSYGSKIPATKKNFDIH